MSTYKSIHDLLKATAQGLPLSNTFRHGLKDDINVFHDGGFPLIWLWPMVRTGSFIGNTNRMSLVYAVRLFFLNQDALDSTPEQQLKVLQSMDSALEEYLIDLNQKALGYDDVTITGISIEPVFRDSVYAASGHLLRFNLTVPDTFGYCCD
jgi:hypothetical protein